MKRWRALSGEKKVFYLLTPGLPLAAVLIPLASNGFHITRWTLGRGVFSLAPLALGFLLGTVNLLLVLSDRQPQKYINAWHVLMACAMLPSLFLVGLELLLLLYAAALSLDPTW